MLTGKYAETPRGMGLTPGGQLVEVYASEPGTWTLLLTTADGVACLLVSGGAWEGVTAKVGDPA